MKHRRNDLANVLRPPVEIAAVSGPCKLRFSSRWNVRFREKQTSRSSVCHSSQPPDDQARLRPETLLLAITGYPNQIDMLPFA